MLHYKTIGEGQPIVLIHGFPGDGSAWDNITPGLSDKYRLIIPDLPGAGNSPLPEEPLTLAFMARSVIEVMNKENIKNAVIAGHSMGGYTALEIAAQAPHRIKGLSLVHSSAHTDTEEKKESRRKAIRLMLKGEAQKEMFLRGAAPNMFAPGFADGHPGYLQAFVDKGMALPKEHLAAFYEAMIGRNDTTDVLKNSRFPVQWIIGMKDQVIPKEDVLQLVALSAVADVQLYGDCGHLAMQENPERLARDLDTFIVFCSEIV